MVDELVDMVSYRLFMAASIRTVLEEKGGLLVGDGLTGCATGGRRRDGSEGEKMIVRAASLSFCLRKMYVFFFQKKKTSL